METQRGQEGRAVGMRRSILVVSRFRACPASSLALVSPSMRNRGGSRTRLGHGRSRAGRRRRAQDRLELQVTPLAPLTDSDTSERPVRGRGSCSSLKRARDPAVKKSLGPGHVGWLSEAC